MVCCLVSLLGSTLAVTGSAQPATEYLSDLLHRFVVFQQGWGELGIDTCAHAPGGTPLPLRIGEKTYAKGLGHHAPGEIVVDLNGEYALFEAEVGVQWQQGTTGSVVFQVYVDGKKRFDSGVRRETDPPLPVRIRVEGAGELRLVVTDAGDGITCDCANWAEARLARSTKPRSVPGETTKVDVAPFARVMTSDPQRTEGCRAGRTEEYLAEDLFLETPLPPDGDGVYTVPMDAQKGGSIGLHWLERRRLTELHLHFASAPPASEPVQLQAWVGESHWQGRWVPLPASVEQRESEWTFRPDWRGLQGAMYGVRKVRWTFAPSAEPVRIRAIRAFTSSRWDETELVLRQESPRETTIRVYNGEITTDGGTTHTISWDGQNPMRLRVRYSKTSTLKADRTVLRIALPDTAFGVAVDDVLAHGAAYVPHAGVLVSRDPNLTIEDFKRRTTRRKTVLQRVRQLPEQTFAQAMQKTHHKAQNNGPILLSLACDNRKFIVERDGTLRYNETQIRLQPAEGRAQWTERRLHGGWLPIPVITWRDGHVVYRQTTFVAPLDDAPLPDSNGWLYQHALCLALVEAENRSDEPASAQVNLNIQPQAEVSALPDGYAILHDGKVSAVVRPAEAGWNSSVQDSTISLTTALPPNGKRQIVLALPAWQTGETFAIPDIQTALARTERYWRDVMSSATHIEIPDPLLLNVIRASQVHCLLAARNEEDGRRVAAWIASMAYGPLESEAHSVIRGMLLLGHREFARRALDYFVHRYHPAGYLTTGYTLMGTGWHLWTLGEYYALTRDREWLSQVAPAVENVCLWTLRQREKNMRRDASGNPVPEYGLMPPGVMADWNAYAYYFALNGYYYAGLHHAVRALADIGTQGASELLQDAERFRKDILRAYKRTQAQMPVVPLQNGAWIPGSPSQVHCPAPTAYLFPGEDANRSWAYDVELGAHQLVPQGVLSPDSQETEWIIDYLEDVAFLESGWFDYPAEQNRKDWFNLGGFSKVQPYYTRNPEIYAMRLDAKPFIRSYFNMLASLLNEETLWLWEHFNNVGAWNKTHETGYFLQQTRFMLATEREGELHLAPLVPSYWLSDGKTIAVQNLLTRFGAVTYRIHSQVARGTIEAEITLSESSQPTTVFLHLRHPKRKPIRRVLVNGREHRDFEGDRIRLSAEGGTLRVQARY
ncbi:MAG: NPCBM/NEW2 domain-containing protein [Chthonomonadetes bacterium]|nr:NPCBM/NEW2 domain-containing protein [Chthonomonadetes bacterium]